MRDSSEGPFELILSRAEGVKRLAENRAIFKAPTRTDRTPSVSLAIGANGTVLLHDFGGDSPAAILRAMGLELRDLYPKRNHRGMSSSERAEMHEGAIRSLWCAALGVLAREAMIVAIAAAELLAGRSLPQDDHRRLAIAAERIENARELLK